jgi:hypothetical protein
MISPHRLAAARTERYAASIVSVASGSGTRRTVTPVITTRLPSLPVHEREQVVAGRVERAPADLDRFALPVEAAQPRRRCAW